MTEHDIQTAFIQWARLRAKTDKRLEWLHSIPNGGYRAYRTASQLKQEGVLPGIADLFLPVASGGLHGLWIEMKTPAGKCTGGQVAFGEAMQAAGYGWCVCRSVDEAVEAVERYLAE